MPGPVLLVGPLPPPPLLGGIETGVALLLRSRVATLVDLRLFNTAREEDPTRRMHQRVLYQLGACLRFVAAVLRTGPRIVHVKTASGVNFFQNAGYVVLGRLLGRRVVLQIHGGEFREFYQRSGRGVRALIRVGLRLPHRLIALSDAWAEFLTSISGRNHVAVIPNALRVEEFAAALPDRAGLGIPPARFAVLFMGTRDYTDDVERKNLPQLVEAVAGVRARHPEVCLVTAGRVRHDQMLSSRLGREGEGWVSVGSVPAERKATLFRSVDLFVLPSRAENMPNVVLEAMAAGLPMVVTRVGAVPEMVSDGESGVVVPPGDTPALEAAIARLVEDPSLRVGLGEQACRRAFQEFDFSALEDRLIRTYGDVADPRASAGRAPIVWWRRPGLQRRVRLVGRLAKMTPAEVAHRLGRVIAKALARRRAAASRASIPDEEMARKMLPAAVFESPTGYLARRPVKGFFEIVDRPAIARRVRTADPAAVAAVVQQADDLLEHGIVLLSRRFRPAHPEFDWLADPDYGRLWPLEIMDDADAVRQGRADVKFVWEVNRHQFLPTLARASVYVGDGRFARAAVTMVQRWISQNPKPLGVNWASNLEVAVRSLSWIWTLHFLVGTPWLSDQELRPWLASLRQHRDHLVQHLSTYTDPTNHLIGEAAALAALSIWLPELEDSAAFRSLALATLQREIGRQVFPDGMSREQSTSYQRFVVDLVLQVIVLADRNRAPIDPELRGQIEAMLVATRQLLGPHGRAPRIGDSDDARGIPFFAADQWNFHDLLAIGASVLGRPDLVEDSAFVEAVLWFGGEWQPGGRSAPVGQSVVLPCGGYAVLRSGPHANADRMIFDCGGLGYLPHASHGHADLLSVLVDVDGEEVLIDPGTFAYWDPQGRRDLLRATWMHNTVEVGGRDQADAFDPFKWLNIPRNGIDKITVDGDFAFVEAWHDGYRRLVPGVRHRRGVLAFAGTWLVIDRLTGRGRQAACRWFHVAPDASLEPCETGVRVRRRGATLVINDLMCAAPATISTAVYCENYGQTLAAPVVSCRETVTLPVVGLTLLSPERDGRSPLHVSAHRTSEATVLRLSGAGSRSLRVVVPAHERGNVQVLGERTT